MNADRANNCNNPPIIREPRVGAISPVRAFGEWGQTGALPLQIVRSDDLLFRLNQIRCPNLELAGLELSCQHLPLNVLTPEKLQKVPNLNAGVP